MIQRIGAPPAPARRRRRVRQLDGPEPEAVNVTRATAIRAFAKFESEEEAARWLDEACEAEDTVDVLVSEAASLLNRAIHAQAVATANAETETALAPERAERVVIGYGSGEETAAGRFRDARRVDVRAGSSRRRRREEELRPQERVAAVLGGRERLDACETLLLRARADLDAGREREAALQLRVGLEALLAEREALSAPDQEADFAALQERRTITGAAANEALRGELDPERAAEVTETLRVCERVLRRKRALG